MSDVIKDLSELRLTYQKGELHEEYVDAAPHEQFLGWFNSALEAKLHEPYAMSLATANAQGRPNRLHDRLAYEKFDGAWKLQRLMP